MLNQKNKIKDLSSKNIVLFGPPSSGKGTQSELLSKEGYEIVTAGDLLRAEKKSGSKLGEKINSIIDKGDLVPDEIVTEIIRNEVKRIISKKYRSFQREILLAGVNISFVFDGYPRTITQANSLSKMMSIDKAFLLDISDNEIVKRALERGKTSNREDDKDEKIIRHRIANYRKETEPLIKYYEKENKLIIIDGYKSIEEVNKLIMSNL